MSAVAQTAKLSLEARARRSGGTSESAIYEMVAQAVKRELANSSGDLLVDVGCGRGALWPYLGEHFGRTIGVDAIRYDSLPAKMDFRHADLDAGGIPVASNEVEVVVAVETIEHLENPRAFFRELTRITRPGGLICVTTPNQLSLLSLITLLVKRRFSAFQDVHYPAHLSALLAVDLHRMAAECGLVNIEITYSRRGRVMLTPWHYPKPLSQLAPRLCSDNVMLTAKKASSVK